MKVSCNWLKDYVDVPPDSTVVADLLTMCGLEVENVEYKGLALEGIIVGRVLSVRPHPKADRLTLCDVDLGTDSPVQIVCGAPNVATGQRVPVATIGSTLQLNGRPVRIRKAKLRGESSMGMICSEDELGLSDDHSGIMVLDTSACVGEPLAVYLGRLGVSISDTVLDVAITPNRPDATCHIGVARDLAALTQRELHLPKVTVPAAGGDIAKYIDVEIECPELCGRYVAMMVRGVRVGTSPPWLKQRLEAIGLRPINNVVDSTNFVMHESGQPLHAFDYDRIAGQHIFVRTAIAGEEMTTLDGKWHTLTGGAVLICDSERPVAIGGVMGGANSEVDDNTTNVLIESAWFDPSSTRKSARALGVQTDASYRFERGVDASGQARAAARCTNLIAELAGGTLVEGLIDVHPNPLEMPQISLRLARIPVILGIEVPQDDIERILTALGFGIRSEENMLHCSVPSWRPDVHQEIDLIEEVARIYGYDKIAEPRVIPLPGSAPLPRPVDLLRERIHSYLNGRGFREIYTNSLLKRSEAECFSHDVIGNAYPVVETLNAVSKSMTTLRPTLLPGLLHVMQHNSHHGQSALRFYEFGHVFHEIDHEAAYIDGYAEYETLIMGASGPLHPQSWDGKTRNVDFFDLKGDVEALLETLHLMHVRMEPRTEASPLTTHCITLYLGDTRVGSVAQLSEAIQQGWSLRTPVCFAEFNWTRLVLHAKKQLEPHYMPVNRYPVVDRDIAVVIPRLQPVGPLLKMIHKVGTPLLQRVQVFDLYEAERLGVSKKSVAFALRFGAQRTLRDAEVENAVNRIVNALHELCGAQLRS